jgi:DNA repair exonuclease SbcCD nuclease subunit
MEVLTKTYESLTALVIGDPHFKVSNVRETDAMAGAIIRVAINRHPDIIIVLGDILDRHETIHVSPLTRATNFLASLMNIAPTFVLIGNHDLKNNRQFLSDEHPFTALKLWANIPSTNVNTISEIKRITIVDTTTLVTIKGHILVFVPYVPPGRFEEALNRCPGWEQATCIFGHQEFSGAQMGAIVSIEGDKWSLTYPYVVTGHIHDYQEPQINILYTGTPILHAFGDLHE